MHTDPNLVRLQTLMSQVAKESVQCGYNVHYAVYTSEVSAHMFAVPSNAGRCAPALLVMCYSYAHTYGFHFRLNGISSGGVCEMEVSLK